MNTRTSTGLYSLQHLVFMTTSNLGTLPSSLPEDRAQKRKCCSLRAGHTGSQKKPLLCTIWYYIHSKSIYSLEKDLISQIGKYHNRLGDCRCLIKSRLKLAWQNQLSRISLMRPSDSHPSSPGCPGCHLTSQSDWGRIWTWVEKLGIRNIGTTFAFL